MKKSTLLLFALITVFMLSGCEIYSLVKDLTDKEEGRITTTDGKVLTGRVEMPNANTKKLTIVTVDSQKTVLNCEDIKELVVWKKTHTDIKHVLQYLSSHKMTNPKKSARSTMDGIAYERSSPQNLCLRLQLFHSFKR